MDIFVSLCQVDDSHYFMCMVDDFKFIADMIQHIPLELRHRYVFCCAPINKKVPFVCATFLKFVRKFSQSEAITFDWLCRSIGWPASPPQKISDLVHLEGIFDVLDVYLWLSYRFPDIFLNVDLVRQTQQELDAIIQAGILQITKLLKNAETAHSHGTDDEEFSRVKNPYDDGDEYSPKISRRSKSKFQVPEASNIMFGTQEIENKDEVDNDSETIPQIGHGRFANHLVSKGLLTPRMLQELKLEFQEEVREGTKPKSDNKNNKSSKKPR